MIRLFNWLMPKKSNLVSYFERNIDTIESLYVEFFDDRYPILNPLSDGYQVISSKLTDGTRLYAYEDGDGDIDFFFMDESSELAYKLGANVITESVIN